MYWVFYWKKIKKTHKKGGYKTKKNNKIEK